MTSPRKNTVARKDLKKMEKVLHSTPINQKIVPPLAFSTKGSTFLDWTKESPFMSSSSKVTTNLQT